MPVIRNNLSFGHWQGCSVYRCVCVYCLKYATTMIVWNRRLTSFLGTVSLNQAIARQLNLIEEHAVRLRPVELGRSFGSLEIWVARGDSEMACSENTIPLERIQRCIEGTQHVSLEGVGFSCQVVTNQGVGFAIERCNDGTVPGELHPSAEDE